VRHLVPVLFAAVLLAGCESDSFDWLGTPPPPPLPGDRIAILQLDAELTADPEVAEEAIILPPPLPTPNWPQSGGLTDKAMYHIAAPGPLEEIWTADIGEGDGKYRRIIATPVVALGRAYAFDADTEVTAVDAETGKELWDFDITPDAESEGGWGGGLAFYRGRLYVTTGYGELIALDGESGEEYWRVRVGPPLRTPPTVSQGRVFIVTPENELQVLDADTGELLWAHRGIEEIASLLGGGGPAVSGSIVIVTFSSGEIYALRVENGRVVWSDSLAYASRIGTLAALNDINGSPVIDRGRVFAISHGGRLVAIDLATGARLWEREVTGVQTPWIAGNYLYVVSLDGKVVCLEREDGRIRWVTALPNFEDPEDHDDPILWSGPLLAGDRLLVVGSDGTAASISPYTGEILGMVDMGSSLPVAPIAAGEIVYLLDGSGDLIALR
jgi:outer membrane protein assembly factor BamB